MIHIITSMILLSDVFDLDGL